MFIKNKNIIFLFFAQLISHCGDSVFNIALPWFLLEVTGSKMQTGLISTSAYFPILIFGLFAGVIVDKYDRRKIMLMSDFFRFVLILIIPLSIQFNYVSIFLIGSIIFLMASFSTLFYPARDCFIPNLVFQKDLPKVNSLMVASGQIAQFLGPMLAAIGLSLFGLIHLFSINAISFLVSMVFILLIIVPKTNNKNDNVSSMTGIKEGLLYLKNHDGLMALLFVTFINNLFIMGPAYIGLVVFVREILIKDIFVFALLETFMGLGMIIGSIIFPIIINRWKLVNIFFLGILIDGLTFSALYFVKNYLLAIFILFLHGIGIPLIILSRTIYVQNSISDQFRGRIFSMMHMSIMGTTAISIGITGFVLEYISADLLFLFIGIGASACVIIGMGAKNFLCLDKILN